MRRFFNPARNAPKYLPFLQTHQSSSQENHRKNKINCITLSSYFRKTNTPDTRKKKIIRKPRKITLTTSHNQNISEDSPLNNPPTASTNKVNVSVTAVPQRQCPHPDDAIPVTNHNRIGHKRMGSIHTGE